MTDPIGGFEQSLRQMEEHAERAARLGELTADLTGRAEDEYGFVKVGVDANGRLTELALDSRVMRWSAEELAEQILALAGKAQENLSERFAEAQQDVYGDDSGLPDPAVFESFGRNLERMAGEASAKAEDLTYALRRRMGV